MRKILVVLLIAGTAAFLLPPLVVSASGSQSAQPAEPASPEPVVIQVGEDDERSGRGYLGVEIVELTEQLRLRFAVPEGRGVLISEVEEGGAAERAGIEAGDVLVSLGSEPVGSGWELRRRIAEAGAGNQVPLVVIRDGELVELAAMLDGRRDRWSGDRERWDSEEWSRSFEDLGTRIEQAFSQADWERFGARWERSGEDWERFGERFGEQFEGFGERLGERMEELGERLESRFEEVGERVEGRAETWEHDWEHSAAEWERFGEELGEEMERFGEEWGRFGEELGARFENVDWEAFATDVEAAVREAVEAVDWEQLGESIREAVEHLDVHVEPHRR